MSSQAYYLAQLVIILAAAVVLASAAGVDLIGDSRQAGYLMGGIGVILIAVSLVWAFKHGDAARRK